MFKEFNLDHLLSIDSPPNTVVDLSNNSGIVDVKKSTISDDISLFRSNYNFYKDSFLYSSSKEQALCIEITLDGNIIYTDSILNQKINKKRNTMFVKYLNNSHSVFEVTKETSSKNIAILIKDKFLKKFLLNQMDNSYNIQKNYENDIPTLLKSTQTSIKTSMLAHEIYNSPFYGELDNIFLQSKVYDIIYNEFSDILQKNRNSTVKDVKLTKEDIKSLLKAKDLISKEKYFSSLSELSRKVALNEFKLKYGFKKMFHTSPGAMMLEYRMDEAKRLIIESEFNTTEISKLVGYKYIQSFTNAFRKRFGVRPTDLMKSRKYYY